MNKKMLKLRCLIKKEGDRYSSLCLELDVASCGKTQEEAFEGLTAAVEIYVRYLVQEGRENEIYRTVPQEAIREFLLGEVEERKLTPLFRQAGITRKEAGNCSPEKSCETSGHRGRAAAVYQGRSDLEGY